MEDGLQILTDRACSGPCLPDLLQPGPLPARRGQQFAGPLQHQGRRMKFKARPQPGLHELKKFFALEEQRGIVHLVTEKRVDPQLTR
jgi:hypothetical protein